MSGAPRYDGALRDIQSPTGLHYQIHETPEDLAVLTPRVAQEPEIWIDTETADWNTKSPRLSPSHGPIWAKTSAAERRTGGPGTTRTSTVMPSTVARTGSPGSRLSHWRASSSVFCNFTSRPAASPKPIGVNAWPSLPAPDGQGRSV